MRVKREQCKMKICLVVDDSKVIRIIACRIAKELGFEVLEAENGQVALEQCAKSIPDVILLDWNMPVMTGIEFLKAFRQTENNQQAKVVFCTTESEFKFIAEAMESGADEYIMKPFNKEIIEMKFTQIGVL